MQWLNENKAWLFDGAGGVIVISVFGFLIKRFFESKADSKTTTSSSSKAKTSNTNTNTNNVVINLGLADNRSEQRVASPIPSPNKDIVQISAVDSVRPGKLTKLKASEIKDEIDRVPLLAKKSISEHYCGMFVEWNAKIVSIDHKKDDDGKENGIVRIMLQIVEEDYKFFWGYCSVSLNENRELKIVRDNTIVKVIGEIERIEGRDFWLKNVSLNFD
jgi:hypothetical protein